MTDLPALAERLRAATEPDRELDCTIAYYLGLGTDIERQIWEQHGWSGFSLKDENGFTALNRRHGAHVKYSRPGREGRRIGIRGGERVFPVTGPQPLINCPHYTVSIDAALTLVERDDDVEWYLVLIEAIDAALHPKELPLCILRRYIARKMWIAGLIAKEADADE